MTKPLAPKGDPSREAIDSLRGYVYQIYQSALAWIELLPEEFLFLEVAEDYAVAASSALNAVQVKDTAHNVTINSDDIVASIDSFIDLRKQNPELQVRLRHLTTSKITKEKSKDHRIDDTPTLDAWRRLAKTGDLAPLRKVLDATKISEQTKSFIRELNDTEFRDEFLKRIHFDCGALNSTYTSRQLRSKLSKLIIERGGNNSQLDDCLNKILITLLQKTILGQRDNRFVDRSELEEILTKATQISINRSQFETQNQLVNKLLAAAIPTSENLTAIRLSEPKPIYEVPFPKAIANRKHYIDNILISLTQYGVSWIYGGAGVGKTLSGKLAARCLGGSWASINLRGLNAEQVSVVLSDAIDLLTENKLSGFLIDDIECSLEPHVLDKLLFLCAICERKDRLLLFTSSKQPTAEFLFSASLPVSVGQKLEEFSEQDIQEILTILAVNVKVWARYIHLVSGGGHPQLVIAAIQSMQNNGWNVAELETFDSLLFGNLTIEQVRARTRERLLNELPEGSRRLLARLSLKLGGFRRDFVLDMAQAEPAISDGGILFDGLIGSWVNQLERDLFALSPLLSNFAANTLTNDQQKKIHFRIANSLIKGKSINPIDANSAIFSALLGKNTNAIAHLCMAVLGENQKNIEMIAPYLTMFTLMRTDASAYEDDPRLSQMFRGAQLLLVCNEKTTSDRVQEVIDCFAIESAHVLQESSKVSMVIFVYSTVLLSDLKFGALPKFLEIIAELDELLENKNSSLPSELMEIASLREIEGIPNVAFMFLNQMRQVKLINELLPAFEFLNSCEKAFREKLLKPFSLPDFGVDYLVSSPWLNENKLNTIDPVNHSLVFKNLEEIARGWPRIDLAVCCRRIRAVIIDEDGGDKDGAIEVINEAMMLYGETNSVLVRAKAKVLYRAEEHQDSLELSKSLIQNGSLNDIENAFLGREAAISAEKQGDYETARTYYLFGSAAAARCKGSDMLPMRVGLMADAALASWHAGDRETCLRDLILVLQKITSIDPESSIRAAHCHALCRHILLWLDQASTGVKRFLGDGSEVKIYPGVVSNPEPNLKIGETKITPIEMAWYMLASIENNCYLDVGITKSLKKHLPKGELFEGQILLTLAKLRKSFKLLDVELFEIAMNEAVVEWDYLFNQNQSNQKIDMESLEFRAFPVATLQQQLHHSELTEQFVLCFVSNYIFRGRTNDLDSFFMELEKNKNVKVRKAFSDCLLGDGAAVDFNTSLAALLALHKGAIVKSKKLVPAQIFEFVFQIVRIAKKTNNFLFLAESAFKWLSLKWSVMLDQQKFLLRHSLLDEELIAQILIESSDSWDIKIIDLLQAILPAMGFSNESELRISLNELRPPN